MLFSLDNFRLFPPLPRRGVRGRGVDLGLTYELLKPKMYALLEFNRQGQHCIGTGPEYNANMPAVPATTP